jgi:hypothetical protein
VNQKAYDQALEWFLERVPLTGDELQLIEDRAEEVAWLVANNFQLRLCQSVLDRIEQAIEEGQPFDEFKAELIEWFP